MSRPVAEHIKALDEIVANLGDIKITASALCKQIDKRFTRDQCREALERAGKLLRVGRGAKMALKHVHDYVKALPDKIPASKLAKLFNIRRSVATDILKKHQRFLKLQHHDRRKKVEGETLPPTAAELARALPEPMTAHEFSKRYGKTMKTSYAALRDAGKFKPKQFKSKTPTAPKPRTTSEPKAKTTLTPKPERTKKSFDKFYSSFSRYARRIQDDEFAYID